MPILIRHPASAHCAVDSLFVDVELTADQQLHLRYTLHADLQHLRIPASSISTQTFMDNLWQHTCFEAFIRGSGESYDEFNFSPNGAWAAYRFSHYRQRIAWQTNGFPQISAQQTATGLIVDVIIPSSLFTLNKPQNPLLALSAVLENYRGEHSWWALCHPSEQPDFHHPQSFTYAIRS